MSKDWVKYYKERKTRIYRVFCKICKCMTDQTEECGCLNPEHDKNFEKALLQKYEEMK